MQKHLQVLEELQIHDARMLELESELKSLPEKIRSMKDDVDRVAKMLQMEAQKMSETEKFRREQEGQLKLEESGIAKARSKLQQVKSGKEHMAAQREIEGMRKIVSERDTEMLHLLEAIETTKKSMTDHNKDLAELKTHVQEEETKANARMVEISVEIAQQKQLREKLAAQVPENVIKRYCTIRMKRGLAVVRVIGGSCQGCHMTIPPQLYNILQRGNSIEVCPSCQRIVYFYEIQDTEGKEATNP